MAATVWCFLVPLVLVFGTITASPTFASDDLIEAELPLDELERRCPPNEKYDKCNKNCEKNCTNINDNPAICPLVCVPGCVCDKGLVRGPRGRCIKPSKCPAKVCPIGEHHSECHYHCQRNCTNWKDKVIICPKICVPGCVCNRGTVRSSLPDGKCIKPDQCPHETWEKSEDDDEIFDEEEIPTEESEEELEKRRYCPPNEEFIACKAHCELNCKTKNETEPVCPGYCVSGCRCESGYVRGPKGFCIKPDKCPVDDDTRYPVKRVCPRREIWNPYVAHCQGNCSTGGKLIPCVRIAVAGCICKKGLYRRDDGVCIPLRKCPKNESESSEVESFCPQNEIFVAGFSHCEKDCKNKNETIVPCNRAISVSGCRCLWGYVRGPKGTCIKPEKCPAKDDTKYPVKRVCPSKEHWDPSTAHCQKNCTTLDKQIPCAKIAVGGCVCDKGLFRRKDGKCIPRKECPKKNAEEDAAVGSFCPQFEIFVACFSHCEKDCKTRNETVIQCKRDICVSGCQCVWGYVRGPKGTCIKPEECPAKDPTKYPVKRVCPRNEHWETSTAHCQKNCTNLDQQIPCLKIRVPGCVCKKGLYRAKNGKCVPKDQCTKRDEGQETWEREDERLDEIDTWEREDERLDEEAKDKTFCPKNEIFVACYSHCEKDCKNKNETIVPCKRGICVSGCRCDWKFVRGPKGTCIKPEECPAKDDTKYPVKRVCPRNEHWETATAHCQKNCTNLDKQIPCPAIIVPGCVCNKDLYRAKNGRCVPKDKCPNGAPDELLDEDKPLDEDEIFDEDKPLDEDEIFDEDEILDGDESKDKTFCPKNEVFVACYSHCEKDCKNKNETIVPCKRDICVSGCRCYWGFVRGPKGTCIKPEKCPAKDDTKYPVKRVCPRNEHWNTATAHCQKNCTNLDKQIPCPDIIVPGCVCNKDLYRAKNGRCVPKDKCPSGAQDELLDEDKPLDEDEIFDHDEILDGDEHKGKKFCPPHERFVRCKSHCERDCKNKNETVIPCNRALCVPGCRCVWGYVRGPKGTCIKPDKCPPKDPTKYPVKRVCPRGETWTPGTAHCQKNCTNVDKLIPCLAIAQPGCICDKGLVRRRDGQCIPRNQCPKEPLGEEENKDEIFDHEEEKEETEELQNDQEENGEQLVGSGNCPNQRKCTQHCRDQGSRYGRCVGRRNRTCYCRN